MKQKFDVMGMTCSACSSRVEHSVSKMDGVQEVSVNLLTNHMQVIYDEHILSQDDIIEVVEKAGYSAAVREDQSGSQGKPLELREENPVEAQLRNMKMRLVVSFAFLIPLMYVSMGHMIGLPLPGFLSGHANAVSFALTQFLLCIPVVYVNRIYFINGFKNLFHRAPNMDSLIAMGSAAALFYGIFAIYRMSYGLGIRDMELVSRYHMDLYFESAVMILALITLGKYLETKSKGKTSEAITKLMDLAPKTALIEKNGTMIEIPVEQVMSGDIVLVKPGTSIPVDGVIVDGSSSIDESAITGESIPVHKEAGDVVIAATMNKTGAFRFRATKVGDDTTFSQIIRLVEEASSSKAPIAKIADKIAGVFVPVVITIAVVTAVIWICLGAAFEFALSSAICVLVISCPCALGLATPVAIMVGTGKGAEHGVLIKSGEALENAHNVQCVVLDKTGTITKGKPMVTDVLTASFFAEKENAERELLSIAAALETNSEHPLADAVLEYSKEKQVEVPKVEAFTSTAGRGVEGIVNGKQYIAGNVKFLAERKVEVTAEVLAQMEKLSVQGKTPLLFANGTDVIGIIAVADVVKETSAEAVRQLKSMGIEVVMLTGDSRMTAEAIRKELQIDTVIAEVLPQDKEKEIARLQAQGKTVAMVGDGVNDAPALARADVGMAIGVGTDVALESADIVLMKSDLLDAVTAVCLSKAVIRNIKQNLFWAFFYNCLGIPLAAGVFYHWLGWKLSPMFGAAAMSFSSIFVVTNALRLRKFKGNSHVNSSFDNEMGNLEEDVMNKKEEKEMITMKIEGMMCPHCTGRVHDVLNAIDGVNAEVSLEDRAAYITLEKEVALDVLKKAVEDAGYKVI